MRTVAIVAACAPLMMLIAAAANAQTAPARRGAGDLGVTYDYHYDSSHRSFNGVRISAAKQRSGTVAVVGQFALGWQSEEIRTFSGPLSLSMTDLAMAGGVRFMRPNSPASTVMPFVEVLGGFFRRAGYPNSAAAANAGGFRVEFGADFPLNGRASFRVQGGFTYLLSSVSFRNQIGVSAGVAIPIGK